MVDENLSRQFVTALRATGIDAFHVADVGLSGAKDPMIWDYACREGMTVLTKDEDYSEFLLRRPPHAPVLWIRAGNMSNSALLARVMPQIEAAVCAIEQGSMLVELQ